MLAIEREVGQQLHLIDETGRRIMLDVSHVGNQKVKILITAPAGIAIVRPEKGEEAERKAVEAARQRAMFEPRSGDAA